MSALKRTRKIIVGDLTRTRHMWAVSAVILGATFMPLVGSLPQAYELEEIRSALSGPRETVSEAPAAIAEPKQEARVRHRAPRVQEAALVESEVELTTLALTTEAEAEPALLGADDEIVVEADEMQQLEEPADITELEMIQDEPVEPNA